MSGILYLCATPIGNLSDISRRCIEIFESVDLIAAEDTRRTVRLLNHLGISKPLTSYHEHNKREKGAYITGLLKEGRNVALVSDAGTPAISDPGEDLVRLCIEENITVTSVPGPVAAVNALILSGLPAGRFSFEGFLSVNNRHRHEHLESVRNDRHTLIFYEAPHKLRYTLADMAKYFGGNRRIALARELTKLHEEVLRMTLDEAAAYYEERSPRGEYVIIVEGAAEKEEAAWWSGLDCVEHVKRYIDDGMSERDAIKQAAKDRNVPKREVYNEYIRKHRINP
ncbi:MAG: 16S rRNA (cytidine(1402)-2'-O)-methyltransferase [Oscillospiraceae bacterium]|nr:16S rRNA (cytidine(1402)-2'-O)-methyltransferase [Oscillospiraceae bacterium]